MRALFDLAALLALSVPVAHAADKDPWMQLAAIDRGKEYTVVLRSGRCERGTISKVDGGLLVVEPGPAPARKTAPRRAETVSRPDVLRVGEGLGAREIVYSGRSSWADVGECVPGPREHLTVVLNTGQRIDTKRVALLVSEITIESGERSMTVPKRDVSRVLYVRFKPLPGGYEWMVQEAPFLALFSPKTWQNALKINAMMTVLLYDSTAGEDSSPVACAGQQSPEGRPATAEVP